MKDTPKKKVNTPKAKKIVAKKIMPVAKVATKSQVRQIECKAERCNPWTLSVYIYWFIILFFIASTFYILGRSHNLFAPAQQNAQLTEEQLMQTNDYFISGKDKIMNGDVTGAIADLTTVITEKPDFAGARILRGEAYMQTGDWTRAMEDFNAVIDADPENAVAYYDRSLLNTRLEDYSAALSDINSTMSLVALKPIAVLQERDLYAKRGQLNLWLKNWEGAVADFNNSLARPDGSVKANVYAERAEAYTALGQYQAAMDDYNSAVRVISEQIQGLSTTAEREKLSNDAMSYYEKTAALAVTMGNKDVARENLGYARSIAAALADTESVDRLDNLIQGLDNPTPDADTNTTETATPVSNDNMQTENVSITETSVTQSEPVENPNATTPENTETVVTPSPEEMARAE